MTDNLFGQRLRNAREKAGLSQAALGKQVALSGSMISRFETGNRKPDLDQLHAVLDALRQHGVPEKKTNHLQVAAAGADGLDRGTTNAVALLVHQFMEKQLSEEEQELFSEATIEFVNVYRNLFQAQREKRQRQYEIADSRLKALEPDKDSFGARLCLTFYETGGDINFSLSRYHDAIRHYQRAIQCAQQLELEPGPVQAGLQIKLGSAYRRQARWDEAAKCYDDAIRFFKTNDYQRKYADALRKRASVFLYRSQPRAAITLLKESREICEATDYSAGLYKALQHLGWAHRLLGNWTDAITLLQAGLRLIQESGLDAVNQKWESLKGCGYLGDAYYQSGDIEQALATFQKAEELISELQANDHKPRLQYGDIWTGLAKVYLRMDQPAKAKRYLDKAVSSDISDEEVARKAVAQAERGNALYLLGEHQLAEQHLQEAIFQLRTLGDPFHHASALLSLARFYSEQGRQDELQRIAEQADATAKDAEPLVVNYQIAQIQMLLGNLSLHQAAFEKTQQYCIRAFALALDYNDSVFESIMDTFWREWGQFRSSRRYDVLGVMFNTYEAFVTKHGYLSRASVRRHRQALQVEWADIQKFMADEDVGEQEDE